MLSQNNFPISKLKIGQKVKSLSKLFSYEILEFIPATVKGKVIKNAIAKIRNLDTNFETTADGSVRFYLIENK